jgi:phosphoglycolate phosphatase
MNAQLQAHETRAVLFDLDGTLLDTVADISAALNSALTELLAVTLPESEVLTLVGRGVSSLIERALARVPGGGSANPARLLERFHFHYEQIERSGTMRTRPYPGVARGLAELHALGLKIAVVTNKPAKVSMDLLSRLGLEPWIDELVGGDSGHRKPEPEPLLLACARLGVSPAEALMVGDSVIDVRAARAAGIRILCVPYGYNEGADPRRLPCDGFVESIDHLPDLLTAQRRRPGEEVVSPPDVAPSPR